MAFHRRRGFEIYYDAHGLPGARGREPVLFIMGLGADCEAWQPQREHLAGVHPTIALDNRGIGRSSRVPTLDYRITAMADDAVALLDHLGVARAHVVGVSLGGLIAQRMAMRWPERMVSMVLAATFARPHPVLVSVAARIVATVGWALSIDGRTRLRLGPSLLCGYLPLLGDTDLTAEESAMLKQMITEALGRSLRPEVVVAQFLEVLRCDHRRALATVHVPSLVMVGDRDAVVPISRAEELTRALPNARMHVVSGGGHGFSLLHSTRFNAALSEFLAEFDGVRGARAAGSHR